MKTNKRIGKHHSVWIFGIASIGCSLLTLFFFQRILAKEKGGSETVMSTDSSSMDTEIKEDVTTPPVSDITTAKAVTVATPEDLTPEFEFSLKDGEKLAGEKEISGEVSGAEKVEFYAVKDGSIDPKIYLGKAKNDGNKWEIIYDFSQLPNGDYEILAKIENPYGTYTSDTVKVTVDNKEESTEKTEKQESEDKVTTKDDSGTSASPETTASTEKTADTTAKKVETKKSIGEEMDELTQQEEMVNQSDISEQEKNLRLQEIKKQKELLRKKFISRQEAERLLKKKNSELTPEEIAQRERIKKQLRNDSDGDGLPDYEEERLGTDPFSADSDLDGFLDGDEVRGGFNPLKYSPGDKSDKIVFEEPIDSGKENDFYEITEITYVKPSEEQQTTEEEQAQKEIAISGHSLPNSFVTLYIYSSPIVVTVKADENGSWTYLLDKELEDGEHKVYAAVTDNTGKITAKSKPFVFIKTAKAISSLNKANQAQLETRLASPVKKERVNLIKSVVLVSLISLGLAIVSIGLFIKHHFKYENPTQNKNSSNDI